MQKQFFGPNQEILLEANFDIDKVLVFLPGISGKAHSVRFAPLVQVAEDAGYACARINLWEDAAAVGEMSYAAIHAKLDELFATLSSLGFIEVAMVGKSFGGAVTLTYTHKLISQKIMWAPAIGFADEGEGSYEANMATNLGAFKQLDEITIGKAWLASVATPLAIIHGTADEVVPVANSEKIAAAAQNGTIKIIDGADHSFKSPVHEQALYEATADLLQ